MMIELNHDERELLQEVLEERLTELTVEIRRTDARDFREDLRTRRQVMQNIAARLGGMPSETIDEGAGV